MAGGSHLAMLVGNGLSMAFSDKLYLGAISAELTHRLTSQYTGGDAVATAMHRVANHRPTGDPAADFEALVGAFGGQSDILQDLAVFAALARNGDPLTANAIQVVQDFVGEVQRRGVGHTLEIIMERTYSDWDRKQPLIDFFDLVLSAFGEHITVANLNYDTLVLSALMEKYGDILSDMGDGRYRGTFTFGGTKYPITHLRSSADQFMPLSRARLRLLHLHGSLTYWRVNDNYVKMNVGTLRGNPIWQTYRDYDTFNAQPLVVLANSFDKAQHVQQFPFDVAYEVSEIDFKDADHWLVVGYSFKDDCVNDLLRRCWEARRDAPAILVSTYGDALTEDAVEDAFGWDRGTATMNSLAINRDGAFEMASSSEWVNFTS